MDPQKSENKVVHQFIISLQSSPILKNYKQASVYNMSSAVKYRNNQAHIEFMHAKRATDFRQLLFKLYTYLCMFM